MSNTISVSGKSGTSGKRVLKDYYEVVKGQVYVAIHKDEDGLLLYEVVEPPLTVDDEKIINTIVKYLQERIYREPLSVYLNGRVSEKEFEEDIRNTIKKLKLKIEEPVLEKYIYYIKRDILGFGKIERQTLSSKPLKNSTTSSLNFHKKLVSKYHHQIPFLKDYFQKRHV